MGIRSLFLLTAVAAGLCGAVSASGASAEKGVVIQNFKSPVEFHKAPHQQQMKSFLQGARAEPLGENRFRLSQVRLQTFLETGAPEMTVEAPECFFDRVRKSISSPGPLRVQTADGKFRIEGVGYLWQQTNSSLMISNQVRTFVHPDLLDSQRNSADSSSSTGPLEIASSTFAYSDQQEEATYSGGVQVTGTNLTMTSGELRITVPMKQPDVKAIRVEKDVKVLYGDIAAEGQLANYWAASGILRVTGAPRWQRADQQGSADAIVIDRPNRIFDADGNAYLKLAGQGGMPTALVSGLTATSGGNTSSTQVVEIHSQSYQLRTNAASFVGGVRVRQEVGGDAPLTLVSERMDLTLKGTNEIQTLVAEGGVRVEQGETQFLSQNMHYDAAPGTVRFTGKPEWSSGPRRGRGDLITIRTGDRDMTVTGHAWMQLPAGDLGDSGALPLSATSSSPTKSDSLEEQFAEVTCREYRVSPGKVDFAGDAQVQHPQILWNSERISVVLLDDLGQKKLVAEPNVRFRVTDPKGQTVYGTGDRAVYTRMATTVATNSLVEIVGRPATIQMTNGMTVRNQKLVLDLGKGTFHVPPGHYEVLGPTNSPVDTNAFDVRQQELWRSTRSRSKR